MNANTTDPQSYSQFFTDANKSTDARGSQFNNVGRDQIHYHGTSVSILETLGQYSIPGAAYDSWQREYAPSCLPNTRTDLMDKIWDWVNDKDGRPMCLLSGAAGLGKSTVAQTLAKDCADRYKLAASFFFSRAIPQCSDISKVILTLAYQLAVSIPQAQEPIKEALKADPSIPDKNLAVQFTKLVYQPLLAIKHLISPMIVVIDALDECKDNGGAVRLIEIITGAFRGEHSFPLCFFFTSRMEENIVARFLEPTTHLKTNRLALEDFRQLQTEEEEIARLGPHESIETWVRDNTSALRRVLTQIESGSNSSDNSNTGPNSSGFGNPIFSFPFTLSGGGGNGKRVTSFVDHPLEIDLQKPFTFLAWCYSSDTMDWRTIFSFESPLCHSSLLCVTLMPGGSQIFFAYMRDAQRRIDVIANGTNVPTLAWFHFAFVFVGSTTVALYINGVKEPSVRLDASLFNPGRKRITLGQNKFNGNMTAQWNGKLRNARVFNRALTDEEIAVESKWTD